MATEFSVLKIKNPILLNLFIISITKWAEEVKLRGTFWFRWKADNHFSNSCPLKYFRKSMKHSENREFPHSAFSSIKGVHWNHCKMCKYSWLSKHFCTIIFLFWKWKIRFYTTVPQEVVDWRNFEAQFYHLKVESLILVFFHLRDEWKDLSWEVNFGVAGLSIPTILIGVYIEIMSISQ